MTCVWLSESEWEKRCDLRCFECGQRYYDEERPPCYDSEVEAEAKACLDLQEGEAKKIEFPC